MTQVIVYVLQLSDEYIYTISDIYYGGVTNSVTALSLSSFITKTLYTFLHTAFSTSTYFSV